MALLSLAALSYVLPVTAIGYVIAGGMFLGKPFRDCGGSDSSGIHGRAAGWLDQPFDHRYRIAMKWILVGVMVAATVLSDLLQSYEMKRAGEQSVNACGLACLVGRIVRRRFLIRAIACMAASFFSFMALAGRATQLRGARLGGKPCPGNAAGDASSSGNGSGRGGRWAG